MEVKSENQDEKVETKIDQLTELLENVDVKADNN